ncbi:CHAP domain-containing protein [Leucobacter aridicollis]|uniref:CHAP domain-containing protein n=1 Tax=Leucobacter aridicollis TaxID=283878 RepID=UPI002167FF90|nr:CHAP domain-containing protein [Leucobacter aridicollis]MCS3426734.1 hypothetical protein [Leucobacter aridicollis]
MSGPKLLTFAQWRKQAVGKHIDIDGAFGAQCWDLWADYAFRAHGATGLMPWTSADAGADSGLASSLWLKFPARPGIDGLFTRLGRDITPREGDVAVWARSRQFPDSHVAICTGGVRKGQIECVSQNDLGNANTAAGATRVTWLTTGGLLGYLRPKTSNGLSRPSNVAPDRGQEEDEEMIFIRKNKNGTVYAWSPAQGTKRALKTPEWNAIQRAYSAAGLKLPLINTSAAEAKHFGI